MATFGDYIVLMMRLVFVCIGREKKLSTENLLRFSNVCLLQGLIELGKLVSSANSSSGECLSAVDIWQK